MDGKVQMIYRSHLTAAGGYAEGRGLDSLNDDDDALGNQIKNNREQR